MKTANHLSLLTFDEDEIESVVDNEGTRARATEALAQIRMGREDEVPNGEGLDAAATMLKMGRGKLWVKTLHEKGCLGTFVAALRMRGLAIKEFNLQHRDVMFDESELSTFLGRAESFRCQILVGGYVKGTGILVGPSSVLTAWHVTSVSGPDMAPTGQPNIDVVLADGRIISAVVLPSSSPCGDVEWPPIGGRAPRSDAEVAGRHDVAVLRLKKPAGIHLTFAALSSPPYAYRGPAAVALVSYPNGEWHGVEFATLKKLRNLTARWGYTVMGNLGGSSGGGCFNTNFSLVGIHQGRAAGVGCMVPLILVDSMVRRVIEADEIPPKLWALDGTPESGLVVGRDAFFIGYHAAMRGPTRARGVWIRRVNLKHDVSGLPFSYELLEKMVARSPVTRSIRISFDAMVHDLPNEVARRASAAGVQVDVPEAERGVGVDETEPEAVVADRSRRLAQKLDVRAAELGITLWVFFDHPSVVFGDESRWALAAFVDHALRLDHLRIVLAGYEAIQMPGDQFETEGDAVGEGAPGLIVEYLTDVSEVDVRNLIESAAADMGRKISPERVQEWTDEALKGLDRINGRYDSILRTEIAARLQPRLKQLSDEGGRP